jgi:hypothetical protein
MYAGETKGGWSGSPIPAPRSAETAAAVRLFPASGSFFKQIDRHRRSRMAKPPPSGPHSDIKGVNMDARTGVPNRDPAKGTAQDKQKAEEQSLGRPRQSAEKPGGS